MTPKAEIKQIEIWGSLSCPFLGLAIRDHIGLNGLLTENVLHRGEKLI